MNLCPHEKRRRSKVVVAGTLHLLCEECRALGPALEAAEVEQLTPPRLVDHEAMGEELLEVFMLRDEAEFYTDLSLQYRDRVRDMVWHVKAKYKLRWQDLADLMGMNRKSLENLANYAGYGLGVRHTNHRKVVGRFSDRELAAHALARRRLNARYYPVSPPRVFSPYALCNPDLCHHDSPDPGDQGGPRPDGIRESDVGSGTDPARDLHDLSDSKE